MTLELAVGSITDLDAMALAVHDELTSIAFPAISTGIYRYPIDAACKIAVAAVRSRPSIASRSDDGRAARPIERVVFCMSRERDRDAMQRALAEAT